MRSHWIFLAAALLVSASAAAAPEGMWPDEARGASLPKVDWILVVPAKREADGSLVLWDRSDPWTRSWVVPKPTPHGVRTVAIVGDSEDRRNVDGWSIDSMDIHPLSQLAAKYSAPAIAVAIEDGLGQIAVAGWSPGQSAAWQAVAGSSREDALAALDDLFSGDVSDDGEFDISITGQRTSEDGWIEYRVEFRHPIVEEVLRGIEGLDVYGYADMESPSLIVRPNDGRDVETILRSAGLQLR